MAVEHSLDVLNFEEIARVIGKGNSSNLNYYQIVHKNPGSGINYYRLKQVDYDGTSHYSDIISIQTTGDFGKVLLYPNPSLDYLYIKSNDEISPGEIEITDLNGHIMPFIIDYGESGNKIDVRSLPSGIYIVKLKSGSRILRKRIIKEQ